MCNETRRRIALGQIREDWGQTRIPLRFPEGLPNLAPLESIRITDPNAIIRAVGDDPSAAELVVRRWSWPGPTGKPVYKLFCQRGFGPRRSPLWRKCACARNTRLARSPPLA